MSWRGPWTAEDYAYDRARADNVIECNERHIHMLQEALRPFAERRETDDDWKRADVVLAVTGAYARWQAETIDAMRKGLWHVSRPERMQEDAKWL